MIKEKDNITKDRSLGRIVESGDNWKQITIGDSRYYQKDSRYFPSVSFILGVYPKGKAFEQWLKDQGNDADNIAAESAERGTRVHSAIEQMLKGFEPCWVGEDGYVNYALNEWLMILRFAEFYNTHKPKLIASEYHTFSDEHGFAGTIDLVLELKGELWIIDIKTSNSLHTTYDLQVAAYATSWNEHHPDQQITKTGILWLKANTRKPDATGAKIQGRHWQLKEPERNYKENFEIFKKVKDIFLIENPDHKPVLENYPNSCKLVLE